MVDIVRRMYKKRDLRGLALRAGYGEHFPFRRMVRGLHDNNVPEVRSALAHFESGKRQIFERDLAFHGVNLREWADGGIPGRRKMIENGIKNIKSRYTTGELWDNGYGDNLSLLVDEKGQEWPMLQPGSFKLDALERPPVRPYCDNKGRNLAVGSMLLAFPTVIAAGVAIRCGADPQAFFPILAYGLGSAVAGVFLGGAIQTRHSNNPKPSVEAKGVAKALFNRVRKIEKFSLVA